MDHVDSAAGAALVGRRAEADLSTARDACSLVQSIEDVARATCSPPMSVASAYYESVHESRGGIC